MVGWPGLFGALTGLATARFSVSVNFVTHPEESSPASAAARALKGYWPVSWLVRRALDECRDYRSAVRLLSNERCLSSVLFTVVGVRQGEAVVIERGPDDYVRRPIERGCVLATNHWVSEPNAELNGDLSETDSPERFDRLERLVAGRKRWTVQRALDVLSDGELESDITQHQVVMIPATGELLVAVPPRVVVETELSRPSTPAERRTARSRRTPPPPPRTSAPARGFLRPARAPP
jgi:hypothetical protein